RLARRQATLADHGVVRRDEGLGDGGGRAEVEPVGDSGNGPTVDDDPFGVAAATGQTEDAVADLPFGADADLGHLAGQLDARDIGRSVGWRWVSAHSLEEVGAVDGGGADAHGDLATAGLGRRHLAELEDLGTAEAADDDGLHQTVLPEAASATSRMAAMVL